jgi:hypothetical protein
MPLAAGVRDALSDASRREIAELCTGCHRPRKRVIQYSRDASDGIEKPQRTGYPACARYDDSRLFIAHS